MKDVRLDVYLDDHCGSCGDAAVLAEEAADWFPVVTVAVHRLGQREPLPKGVVAVPAFWLNGRVVQYGTPARQAIAGALLDTIGANLTESEA